MLAALGERGHPYARRGRSSRSRGRGADRPTSTDTGRHLRDHLASGGTLLGEGAHGAMLGSSPPAPIPSSPPRPARSAGVAAGLQISPRALRRLARRLEGLRRPRGRRALPDGAPRTRPAEYLRSARQRVRHLDGPPAPHRLVRRRRRANLRRSLGRRSDRHHEARRARTTSTKSPSASATASTASRWTPCPRIVEDVARLGARLRDPPRLEIEDHGRHPLRRPPPPQAATSASSKKPPATPAAFISTGPRREETIRRPDSDFLSAASSPSPSGEEG